MGASRGTFDAEHLKSCSNANYKKRESVLCQGLGINTTEVSLRQLQSAGQAVCDMNQDELAALGALATPGGSDNGNSPVMAGGGGGGVSALKRQQPQVHGDVDVGNATARAAATAGQLCFLSAFAFALLHEGHGFDLDRNFTVVRGPTRRTWWRTFCCCCCCCCCFIVVVAAALLNFLLACAILSFSSS